MSLDTRIIDRLHISVYIGNVNGTKRARGEGALKAATNQSNFLCARALHTGDNRMKNDEHFVQLTPFTQSTHIRTFNLQ